MLQLIEPDTPPEPTNDVAILTAPEPELALTPEISDTAPPTPAPELLPLVTVSAPPNDTASVVAPDSKETTPPAPENDTPTETETVPDLPLDAAPDDSRM